MLLGIAYILNIAVVVAELNAGVSPPTLCPRVDRLAFVEGARVPSRCRL